MAERYAEALAANERLYLGPDYPDGLLIPVQAAHHNEMMSPAVTE
jgi:hypothetical protein